MEWFKFYTGWMEAIKLCTNTEAGQMIKDIFVYLESGEKRIRNDRLGIFMAMVYETLERDMEKYENAVAAEEKKKEERSEHARHAAEVRWHRKHEEHMDAYREQEEHNRACKNKNIDKDTEKESEKEKEGRYTDAEGEGYDYSSEPPSADSEQPVIRIPLKNGREYPLYRKDVDEYAGLYPAADVAQELRNMRGWSLANPTKRKTINGVNRFINGWLAKAQDRGGRRPDVPENPFLAYTRGEKTIGDWFT